MFDQTRSVLKPASLRYCIRYGGDAGEMQGEMQGRCSGRCRGDAGKKTRERRGRYGGDAGEVQDDCVRLHQRGDGSLVAALAALVDRERVVVLVDREVGQVHVDLGRGRVGARVRVRAWGDHGSP